MRIRFKVRVGQERQLQFVRPELHQVERGGNLVTGDDLVQERAQGAAEMRQTLAMHVKRRRQTFPLGDPADLFSVLAQVHCLERIAFLGAMLKGFVEEAGGQFAQTARGQRNHAAPRSTRGPCRTS
jgi:hypothetical protein